VNLHRDHVAGGAFVLTGALVLAVSSDLPFGTMASPGAGMLPMLLVGFLMAFGAVLFARAADSPPLGTIAWTDAPHAVRVVIVAALAIGLYTILGFAFTAGALLFVLTFLVERRPLLVSAAFSIGVTVLAYTLFGLLLKTPLPRGIMGF
jgi:hypothetical protein